MTLKNHPGSLLEKEYRWQNKMWGYQCERWDLSRKRNPQNPIERILPGYWLGVCKQSVKTILWPSVYIEIPSLSDGNLAKGGDANVDYWRSDCSYQLMLDLFRTWIYHRKPQDTKITALSWENKRSFLWLNYFQWTNRLSVAPFL